MSPSLFVKYNCEFADTSVSLIIRVCFVIISCIHHQRPEEVIICFYREGEVGYDKIEQFMYISPKGGSMTEQGKTIQDKNIQDKNIQDTSIPDPNATERSYKAFISYRHKPLDIEIAKKLHRRIEHYRIPRDLRKGGSDRLGLVFRDQDELPIADNLTRNIETALDHSEFLIVVCSKDTPESLWVQREIAYFLEHHSRDHLLAILISGDPDQSFPRQLVEIRDADGNLVEEIEPLAANIVADSDRERNRLFKTESLRILASLIGCPYDALYGREQRYKMRRLAAASAAVFAVAAVFIGMLLNRNAKIREQLLSSMINESRALSALSNSAFEEGNYRQSLEYALEALPGRNPERPYVAEAEAALSDKLYLYDDGNVMRYTQSFEWDTTVSIIAISPDGSRLAAGDTYGNIRVCDTASGQLLWSDCLEPESGVSDLYFQNDLLLAGDSNSDNTVFSEEGERIRSSESESVLYVPETGSRYLCSHYDEKGHPASVRDMRTGEVVQSFGAFEPPEYLPVDGTLSPDGKWAAVLVDIPSSKSASLYVCDVESGKRQKLETDLLYNSGFSSLAIDFDENGNLLLAFAADDFLKDETRYKGDYIKLYSKKDDWACRFTTFLDYGTASRSIAFGLDLSAYIDCMMPFDEGTVLAARNRMFMINNEDGSIRWQKDLTDRICGARALTGTSLIALAMRNGKISFCTKENGVLGSDVGMGYMDCPYDIATARFSRIDRKKLRFVIIPTIFKNRAAVITYGSDSEADSYAWSDRVGIEPRIIVNSPSGSECASVNIDKSGNYNFILFDPEGQKEPVELMGSGISSYDISDDHKNIRLTDTGKLILCGRVFDFEDGSVTGLCRSGELTDSLKTENTASCEDPETFAVISACTERNGDNTFDLVWWENAQYTGHSSRIPLTYEESGLPVFYARCSCEAVSPQGYALVSAQVTATEAPLYLLYNRKEDKWYDLSEHAPAPQMCCAMAQSRPVMAFQKSGGALCLFDLSSGQELRIIESSFPTRNIVKMIFSPDDRRLFVFTRNGYLLAFDSQSGKELNRCHFSENRLSFRDSARYKAVSAGQGGRVLILYDDTTYSTSAGITLDADSMEYTGFFSGISAYFPQTDSVLVKQDRRSAFIRPLYSVEEMQEIAEEILGRGTSPADQNME